MKVDRDLLELKKIDIQGDLFLLQEAIKIKQKQLQKIEMYLKNR